MKIFITGIAGFLGSHLAKQLLENGHEVHGCDSLIGGYIDNIPEEAEFYQVDCQYLNAMKNLTKGVDVVFHSACTPYEGLSVFSPHLVTQNTFQISTTIFTACAFNQVKRVVNCSSMARYGEQPTIPFTEDMVPNPVDPYGVAKVAAEKTLEILSQVHEFEYVNLVPHNIIGPHQKYDDPYRNVASIMINRMYRGKQPIIYGDGQQKRCFSDIRDILPCFTKSMTLDTVSGKTINIGPDEEFVTIVELGELIADILNFKNLNPIYVDPRPQEVKLATCSADRAREHFKYKTQYSLRESLEHLAQWIENKGSKRFRYHLDIEINNKKTPKTWTNKLI